MAMRKVALLSVQAFSMSPLGAGGIFIETFDELVATLEAD